MLEDYVMENADYAKIKKLRTLHNMETFWGRCEKIYSKSIFRPQHWKMADTCRSEVW